MLAAAAVLPGHQPHDSLLLTATSPNFANDKTIITTSDYLSVSIGTYVPWRSTDGGVTWWVMRDLPNLPVTSIDFSPNYASDRTIYISGGGGVYRSTNGGDSWTGLGPTSGTTVLDLTLSPNFANDGLMLAITGTNQCWRSADRGNTWVQISAPAATLSRIIFNPNYPADKTVLLGTVANGIYRAQTGGLWVPLASASKKVTQILFSPTYATDRTLWFTTKGAGIYRSVNGGANFSQVNSGLTMLNVNSIAVSPTYTTDSTLFVAADFAVFVSSNSGTNWSPGAQVQREFGKVVQTTSHYRSLATARAGGVNYLFNAMWEGLWMSTDNASSWVDLDMIPAYLIRKMNASGTYAVDHSLFATDYGGGALFTSTSGATWKYQDLGLKNPYPDGTAISPVFGSDGKAFLGFDGGMQMFSNGVWGAVRNLGVPTYVRAIATSPNFNVDGTVFVGIDNLTSGNPTTVVWHGQTVLNQGVFRSTDGGLSLAPTNLAGPRISVIAPSPNFANDHTVFASSPDSSLFKSQDGGMNWTSITVTTAEPAILEVDVSPNYAVDNTVLAATSHSGIFKSTDGGATWFKIPGSDLLTGLNVTFSPAYATDNTIFFGTMQRGLLKSTDGGQTLLPTGLPNAFVMNVVLSPNFQTDRTIFATTYQGAYVSIDGGATWTYAFNPARMEQNREGNIWSVGETPVAVTAPNASTSSVNRYSVPGSIVNITFTGSSVTFLAATDSDQGDVQISLDGVSEGAYGLNSTSPRWQVPVWSVSNLPCAVHKLTLTVATSNAGKTGMMVDAFDYGRETCPH